MEMEETEQTYCFNPSWKLLCCVMWCLDAVESVLRVMAP